MGKALKAAGTRTQKAQASGRVVRSTSVKSKPSSAKSGKAYKSTKLGKMC